MRALVILSPFLLAIGGLVWLQAGNFARYARDNPDSGARIPLTGVTRLAATLPPDAAPRPTPRPALPRLDASARPAAIVLPVPAPDPVMQALSAALSGAPATSIPPPMAEPPGDDILALTRAVLAGLSGQRDAAPPPPGAAPDSQSVLADLVIQAVRQSQSQAYVDIRLNAAAARGEITVPAGFLNADDRVDTEALLTRIARTAALLQGTPGAPRDQASFYVVQEGDSLGSIARKFYGDAARFQLIYDANRALLASPDRLRVGQRLRIPDPAAAL